MINDVKLLYRQTDCGVNEQYPEVIHRRRQALALKMHEERQSHFY
jgi:hypothetical protein